MTDIEAGTAAHTDIEAAQFVANLKQGVVHSVP